MTETVYEEVKAEPKRDRFGRYVIVPANGGKPKSYTRATTIAETLDDRFNLEAWKVRTTALGIVQRPDLYAAIASTPGDDKQALNRLCDQAREAAAGSAGANLGTALHRFTERINRGEDVVVPAPWDADVAAYKATLEQHGLVVDRRYLERIVVLDEAQVAGMFDLIVGGRIADLKTGATLDFSWGAIAVQLALYSRADALYNPVTDQREPMPAVDQELAYVIHLPAGKATCTLYEVNIAAGWEAAQQALWVRRWRKDARKLAVPVATVAEETAIAWEEAHVASPKRREALRERILALPPQFLAEMAAKWPAGVPTFKQSDRHTDDELDQIQRVLTSIDWGGPPEPPEPLEPQPDPLPPAAIDEGATLDEDTVAAVKGWIAQLDKVTTTQVVAWVKEAWDAGVSFSLSMGPTQRRLEIMRAAVELSPYDADVVRAAIATAIGDGVVLFDITIGEVLGNITIDEAVRLCEIAHAIGTTYSVVYDKAGPRLVAA